MESSSAYTCSVRRRRSDGMDLGDVASLKHPCPTASDCAGHLNVNRLKTRSSLMISPSCCKISPHRHKRPHSRAMSLHVLALTVFLFGIILPPVTGQSLGLQPSDSTPGKSL